MLEFDRNAVKPSDIAPAPRAGDSQPEDVRRWREAILAKLSSEVGADPERPTDHDWFVATALALRERMTATWREGARRTDETGAKRVYYFSLEFLIGRLLADALCNLNHVQFGNGSLGGLDR